MRLRAALVALAALALAAGLVGGARADTTLPTVNPTQPTTSPPTVNPIQPPASAPTVNPTQPTASGPTVNPTQPTLGSTPTVNPAQPTLGSGPTVNVPTPTANPGPPPVNASLDGAGGQAGSDLAGASDPASCSDLRNNIAAMENGVPSAATLPVDLQLRNVYIRDCLRHPSSGANAGSAANDPWFAANGDPASGPPPQGNGVYQTTPQIASYCQGSSEPQICALMLNLNEGEMLTPGGDPKNPADWYPPERAIDPADELPPLELAAGGRTFPIDDACLGGLTGMLFPSVQKQNVLGTVGGSPQCAGELNAINGALGALQDAMEKWYAAALRDQTKPINSKYGQPGFLEMCSQAYDNQNSCAARQSNMGTAGTDAALGFKGQAGAFGECASLYGSVVAMCKQAGVRFPNTPRLASTQPTKQQKNPPAQAPPPKKKDTSGGSSAPPKETPAQAMAGQMPASCGPAMQKYLDDVGNKQSGGAVSSYQQLAASGECRDAMKRIADEHSLALPERQMTPLTRSAFGAAFNKDPNAPLAAPTPGYTGSYGGGGGDDVDPQEVLEFGMALLNLGIGAANLANAMHGAGAVIPTTNFNSLAGPIIRNGVGQGAPTRAPAPPPRTYAPCGSGPVCSAQ